MKRLCLLLTWLIPLAATGQEADTLSTDYLQEHVKEVDLQKPFDWLDNVLDGVEVVLLGEQGHGNGSTFEIKTKVIKYLHEHQGFNVLAFESGMLDTYKAWEAIQSGVDTLGVFDRGIFPVWTKSEQVQSLFHYILEQAKTDHPLILAGFDMQPTGSTHKTADRYAELNAYLTGVLGAQWESDYSKVSDVYQNTREFIVKRPTEKEFREVENQVADLASAVSAKDASVQGGLMSRAIQNFFDTIVMYTRADMQQPSNTPHVFNLRDKRMAENFRFLKEEMFAGEKIIGWGANSHFGYGRGLLGTFAGRDAPEQGMVPMAQYLKIDYREKLYSLAFTSYTGMYGTMQQGAVPLPEAAEGTLEYQLHQMELSHAFLNLRDRQLAAKRFVAHIYGHGAMSGRWAVMADGIFYIDYMEASKFK